MSAFAGTVMCVAIPYVPSSVNKKLIFEIFKNLGWGFISYVDLIQTSNSSSKVYIHFSKWNKDFEYKRQFFYKHPKNRSRVYYNREKNLYFNVRENLSFRNWRYKIAGVEDPHKTCNPLYYIRPQRANSITLSDCESDFNFDEPYFMNDIKSVKDGYLLESQADEIYNTYDSYNLKEPGIEAIEALEAVYKKYDGMQ